MKRAAFIVALFIVYASAMRLTAQAPGGVGAQGARSAARDWTQDMAMKIWARHDGPLSRRGLPMTAPPAIAQRILQRLQKLSEPFGTKIAIEGNVGIIRMASQRPTSPQ